jgi:tRNA A37 methylthiotransferase MiaB
MLNLAFYYCCQEFSNGTNQMLYVPVTACYLKTHIDFERKELAAELNWILPIVRGISDQDLIDFCWTNKVDLLGVSLFVWNRTKIEAQMARVRSKLPPNLQVIAGGPAVDPNNNHNYLQENFWCDYAVYGNGESAFADVVESIMYQRRLIRFNTSNLAWRHDQQDKTVLADYKMVPEPKISPYLHCEDMLKQLIDYEHSQGWTVTLAWQLTRGCPYKCTFCDWNLGLGNKTTRRKNTWQQEIDMFQRLGVKRIFMSDANLGQYDEDVEIYRYFAKKNLEENAGFLVEANYSKLKKKVNLELMHIAGAGNMLDPTVGFTFSVQDIHPEVLKNIDRPDVSWQVHKEMILELQQAYPEIMTRLQLILGLPGQTLQSWKQSLCETSNVNAVCYIFMSELLPGSPSVRDPEYQKKYQFVYSNSLRLYHGGPQLPYRSLFPQRCYSFDEWDLVQMTVLSHIFIAVQFIQMHVRSDCDVWHLMDLVEKDPHYHAVCKNLYENWTKKDQFVFTEDFGGAPMPDGMSACMFEYAWHNNKNIIKLMMQATPNIKIHLKKYLEYMKQNEQGNVNIDPAESAQITNQNPNHQAQKEPA